MRTLPASRHAGSLACGALIGAALLTGCVGAGFDRAIADANGSLKEFTNGELALAGTEAQRRERAAVAEALLAAPLSQADAVRLALLHSPSMQALLAEARAEAASAAQAGRIANPLFTFERTATDAAIEYDRLLSIGLLDLLLLPQKQSIARHRLEVARIALSQRVVEQVTAVRATWVRAVAAEQQLVQARRVRDAADASAELASRMEAAGNFSRLARARQQAFYADAVAQLAMREHRALAMREALVRLLGLDNGSAAKLELPERLPDLPAEPRGTDEVSAAGARERLDVQLARAAFADATGSRRLGTVTSLTDIEAGARRGTERERADGHTEDFDGYELEVRLPLFDWGGLQREALGARALAAGHRVEQILRAADSHLREAYSAYRTSFDLARHWRDEIVPLRKRISEENLLRYNGMIIGVFELLADAREQAGSVIAAIEAEEQFWIADAALRATIMGAQIPTAASGESGSMSAGSAARGDAGGH